MLIDDLKARLTVAMKERDDLVKNILRLALGEMQTAEARAGRPVTPDETVAIVRKLIKSNEETRRATTDTTRNDELRRENEVLMALLPASMTVEEIAAALAPEAEAIRAAKNDGQATGVAMKAMKAIGRPFESTDVGKAVTQIRGI